MMKIHLKFCKKLNFLIPFLVILGILFLFPSTGYTEDANNHVHVGFEYEIFIDDTNEVTIDEISSDEWDHSFVDSQSKYPYFDYTSDTIWLKIEQGDFDFSKYNWFEFIDRIESVEVYFTHPDRSYTVKQGGLDNLANWELPYRSFLFQFPNKDTEEVYLKLNSLYLPISVITTLYTDEGLFKYNKNYKLLSGIFYGFMLSIAMYNLFLYFSLRERAYLFYTLFIFSFLLLQACMNSLDLEYLNGILPSWLLRDSISLASLLICITMIFFGRAFLETNQHIPKHDRLLFYLLVITVVILAFFRTIPSEISQLITPLLVFITSLCLWVAAIRVMLLGNRMARFYLIGWTLLLTTIIIQALSYLNIIPFHKNSFELIPQVAACLEGLFLSFALADKINLIKKEREKEQYIYTQKLIETDKAKDEFLFRTSHELKTPLHGIINIAQASTEQQGDHQRLEKNLQLIQMASHRMSNTINDLLDMAKMKENKLHVHKEIVDLHNCTANVLELLRFFAIGKDISIENKIDSQAQYIIGDQDRVIQILYNLISNSIKHTENGKIVVSSQREQHLISISVEDTGQGIPVHFQSKIFVPYEQVIDSNNPLGTGGTGLGLSISKQLAERMDGTLNLDWSKLGKGTRFSLVLPVADTNSIKDDRISERKIIPKEVLSKDLFSTKTSKEESRSKDRINWSRILIVDDEVINTVVLQQIFSSDAYIIDTAYSGHEALQKIKADKPDLVILDVMLPKMSGYDVSKQIRKEFSLIEIPILFVTVRDSIQDIKTGFECGGNDYVTKPFVTDEIRARVQQLLNIKQLTEQKTKHELAFLRSQIKPHFLFNSINVIMYICYVDSKKAANLLATFSEYLRHILQTSEEDFVTIESELNFVEAYVMLEQTRYGDSFDFILELDKSLNTYHIPVLSIQPLVENAIRHGIIYHRKGDWVRVTIKNVDDYIHISIQDNGVGFNFNEQSNSSLGKDKSIGIQNIRQRLKRYYNGDLEIKSKEGQGTTITFEVPNNSLNEIVKDDQ